MDTVKKVSVHGGHSGQFCNHAADSLEEVVCSYIEQGFSWVGITEHAPGTRDELLYQDEREAGLTVDLLLDRLDGYMIECRRLQRKYRSRMQIFAAIEIETQSGYETFVPKLQKRFRPDYFVGSVHCVNDINFDYSPALYEEAVRSAGGIENLYGAYFDLQYDMIKRLEPAVVGHFDLIRIYDDGYAERLVQPAIVEKIRRNLHVVKQLDLILDFNLRALHKGAAEPYVTGSILELVREYGIKIVPGDDSHGVATVGNFFADGLAVLRQYGFSTDWPQPVCYPADEQQAAIGFGVGQGCDYS